MRGRKRAGRIRLVQRQRMRITMRQRIAIGSLVSLVTVALFFYFNLSKSSNSMAATLGDYRSSAAGNWSSASTWETYNGSAWVAAVSTPTNLSGSITIRNGYDVTVSANVSADQVTVESGATLTLNSTITLTIANGTGTDLDVSGIYKSAGTTTISPGATIAYQNGGKYQHNFTTTAGTIPTATWNTGSACEVIGYTSCSSPPSGIQAFYDFTWNCPLQTNTIDLAGGLSTVNGNFKLASTGTGQLTLSSVSSNLTIGGNYIQTGGTFLVVTGNNDKDTLFVAGNYDQSGGTVMNTGNPNTRTRFVFNGSGTKTIAVSGSAVISTAGNSHVCFTVNSGTTLNLANYSIGGYDFTVNSGAGLMIGSANGITGSGASGNVQGSGARSFSTGADYTYNGSSAQQSGNGLPSTVHNLTISNAAGVTLSGNVAVSNALTLSSGKINTGAYDLSVTNTATGSTSGFSSSNYVIGSFKRTVAATGTYDFPLGTSANYESATISLSGITGFTVITGIFTQGNPVSASYPLTGVTANSTAITAMLDYGYWTFTPNSAMTGGTYSITLNLIGATNANTNPQSLCVLKRSNSSSSWASVGTHSNSTQSISGSTVTAVRSGLTGFSDFGIGESGGGSLPIKLKYFTAKLNDGKVNLDWATAAEINNSFFTIERSTDGEHFEALFTKQGAGNSTSNLYYSASDENPLQGFSYYRLKQTDYDGHYTYSDIETIRNGEEENPATQKMDIISIAPNPFSDEFRIVFRSGTAAVADFMLTSQIGQLVAKDRIQTEAGVNTYNFTDKYNLNNGIYFITLICEDQKISKKVIKN